MERELQKRGGDRRVSAEDLQESIKGLASSLDKRHQENVRHMDENTVQLKEIKQQLQELREGFPGNDPDGHRRYHEELIREAEERRKLWIDWRSHMMKMGSWAALGLALYQLRDYLRWLISNYWNR